MRSGPFLLVALAVAALVFGAAVLINNDYVFFAGYVVLQYIVLATAWNILGGYCGYVNFGSAAFFALGAYSSVFLYKAAPWVPMGALILISGLVSGVVGLGMGYLTLRLRGSFFAIATLAMAVVLQTLIVNWEYVGGSRGAYIIRPSTVPILGNYIQYLFLVMLLLAVVAITVARMIERSRLGYGFASIRDDEIAAEACGVPTLRLKLVATTVSGAFMGMAGAPFPYYIGYLQPSSAFALDYAVNSIAMPMIGGTTTWVGPLIGAILLATLQQVATVTISSAINLLIVGLLIVDCVIIAPNGIVGLFEGRRVSSDVVAERPVFSLLYVLNAVPIYFLHQQGPSARPLELVFWAILVFVTWIRAREIGHPWLTALPIVGAVVSGAVLALVLLIGAVPGLGWLGDAANGLARLGGGIVGAQWLPLLSALINAVCLISAVLLTGRRSEVAIEPVTQEKAP